MVDIDVLETTLSATDDGPEVSAVLMRPGALALMVFGHGAGMSMQHPIMEKKALALARQGVATFRFNYPYTEQGRDSDFLGSVDPLDVLLSTVRSAVVVAANAAPDLPLFVGGRSMSSQVMSLGVANGIVPEPRGVVLFVFPMRWRDLLDDPVAHLKNVFTPMLFVQGNRDHYTDVGELKPELDSLGDRATLRVVDGADHFYQFPESSGRAQQDAMSEVAEAVRSWMGACLEAKRT